MTLSEFVDSLSELNDGENFPRDVLSNIYSSLRNEPIEVKLLATLCLLFNLNIAIARWFTDVK